MLSKTCGYAIRGLVYLALKNHENRKIGIQELARELHVPQHFMGKIMQDLVRRAIIGSTKGPHGGFFLSEHTLQTPLIRVIEAIDGLGAFRRCQLGLTECSGDNPCPLHDQVVGYRDALYEQLNIRTIQDLVAGVEAGTAYLVRPPVAGPAQKNGTQPPQD